MRLHGGVVTQRIANPCTPVRFRVEPPSPTPGQFTDVNARRGLLQSVNPELTIWGDLGHVFFGDTHHHPTPLAGAHAPAFFLCGEGDPATFRKLCSCRT